MLLTRETVHGILQSFQDFKTRAVREGFEYFEQIHGRDNIGISRYVNTPFPTQQGSRLSGRAEAKKRAGRMR
jgi:hypothetical protein